MYIVFYLYFILFVIIISNVLLFFLVQNVIYVCIEIY